MTQQNQTKEVKPAQTQDKIKNDPNQPVQVATKTLITSS